MRKQSSALYECAEKNNREQKDRIKIHPHTTRKNVHTYFLTRTHRTLTNIHTIHVVDKREIQQLEENLSVLIKLKYYLSLSCVSLPDAKKEKSTLSRIDQT